MTHAAVVYAKDLDRMVALHGSWPFLGRVRARRLRGIDRRGGIGAFDRPDSGTHRFTNQALRPAASAREYAN